MHRRYRHRDDRGHHRNGVAVILRQCRHQRHRGEPATDAMVADLRRTVEDLRAERDRQLADLMMPPNLSG